MGLSYSALLAIVPSDARAHSTGMSQSEFVVLADGHVEGQLVFAVAELAPAVTLDRDHDGVVTPEEVHDTRGDLGKLALDGVQVTADGATCPAKIRAVELTEGDGLSIALAYACARGAREISVTLFVLSELRPGHRHAARIVAGDRTSQKVLSGTSREVSIEVARPRDSSAARPRWRNTVLIIVTAAWFAFMVALIVWRYRRAPRPPRTKPR